MRTAVATLCTGEYVRGARVLFHTLRKYGNLPESVTCVAMGIDHCDFAEAVPLGTEYAWLPVCQRNFSAVGAKFHALTLPFDRVILLDSDMLCTGDCSLLWSRWLDPLPFWAVRDVASMFYYREKLGQLDLDHSLLFNGGTMVFNLSRYPYLAGSILGDLRDQKDESYDGGDQGYLNNWFQRTGTHFGFLPLEYNACTDQHFPRMEPGTERLVHFTGGNINPWAPRIGPGDVRWLLIERWRQEEKEAAV